MNNPQTRLTQLMLGVGIALIALSLFVNIYDPENQLKLNRDQQRLTDIQQLKDVVDSYRAISGQMPGCDELDTCPSNFPITGVDGLSEELKRESITQNIPIPPSEPTDPLCAYQAYLYPYKVDKYSLRWCMESWDKNKIDALNAAANQYNCTWVKEKELTICFAGPGYEIPKL